VKSTEKKPYEKPSIRETHVMQGRSTTCAAADDASCGAGPINS